MYIKQAMANKTRIGLVLRCCRYTDDKFKVSPSLSVTIQFSPGNVKHRYLEHISFNKLRMKLWYVRIVVDMRAMAVAPRLGVVWLRNMLHVLTNLNFWLELFRVFLLKCEERRFEWWLREDSHVRVTNVKKEDVVAEDVFRLQVLTSVKLRIQSDLSCLSHSKKCQDRDDEHCC